MPAIIDASVANVNGSRTALKEINIARASALVGVQRLPDNLTYFHGSIAWPEADKHGIRFTIVAHETTEETPAPGLILIRDDNPEPFRFRIIHWRAEWDSSVYLTAIVLPGLDQIDVRNIGNVTTHEDLRVDIAKAWRAVKLLRPVSHKGTGALPAAPREMTTDQQRGLVRAFHCLRQDGQSFAKIAALFGLDRRTVSTWYQRYAATDHVCDETARRRVTVPAISHADNLSEIGT